MTVSALEEVTNLKTKTIVVKFATVMAQGEVPVTFGDVCPARNLPLLGNTPQT